ncbi:leucine-rich repeat protein [Ructibacterium gallinarum]|uniref:Leucine-rich repeat protein n=1 Tax=Ructibacterium gallinarum TaxID=2779355 RepID=A0A9D5M1F4_9FIRM|nr:leucine-rich repeat protein [Ructibacterium gallinarum]MBE5040371.1 leucine-rich repeat protein [Ructibacterium gallinarum]
MQKKFFLPVIMGILMAVLCTSVVFAEEETYKEDIFTYTVSNGQATITNVDDSRETVTIPEKLGDCTVTALAGGACGGSSVIQEITLPDTITVIGEMCFAYSTGIRTVHLSAQLQNIEDGAFYQCESLWTITIPSSVQRIGANAFALCSNLSAATIPAGVTDIGSDAFQASGGFRIYAKPDTAGAYFAVNNGIQFEELITVNVNGNDVVFDQPCITDTRYYKTMVPLRAVMEALGAQVSWDYTMNTTGIDIGGNRLLIRPGEPFMMVNGQAYYLSCPAIEFNDRVLLPIRDVVEAIGGKVGWDEGQKLVTITYQP